MPQVRLALKQLEALGLPLWEPTAGAGSPMLADRNGRIYLRTSDGVVDTHGQTLLPGLDVLALTAPYAVLGLAGPDLVCPRPHLRIVPARVAGEPHVEGSRITSLAIVALAARGLELQRIATMYDLDPEIVEEALDLENQLAQVVAAA